MADQVHVSQDVPGPASEPSGGETPHQFGLTAAMACSPLLGIPVYLAQRRHLTPPVPAPAYR